MGPGGQHRGFQGKPGQGGMRPNDGRQRSYNNGMQGRPMHNGAQMMGQPPQAAPMNQGMNPMAQQQQQMQAQQHQMQAQQQQQSMTMEQRYLVACHQIIHAIAPENPNYKDQVGTVLYEYITALVGPKAPKVTGMIIDLPIEDIRRVMQDWTLLSTRVQQASELLDQQQ